MSRYSRPIFSRPRTKVYDTNYNIGESYYRSALDGIDRKYGRMAPDTAPNGDYFGTRSTPPLEKPAETSTGSGFREIEEEFFGDGNRRKHMSNLLGEFDSIFEGRTNNEIQKERMTTRKGRTLESEIEDDVASSMSKFKAGRSGISFANDVHDETLARESRLRSKLDFSDKVMDSVGLTGKARAILEEEGSTMGRRFLRMASDSGEAEELTKWTALRPTLPRKALLEQEDDAALTPAAARALKSRARLDDLETEMQALSERSAAREKRVRDLKALVRENEASSIDNLNTTIRVKTSLQSEKKVTF